MLFSLGCYYSIIIIIIIASFNFSFLYFIISLVRPEIMWCFCFESSLLSKQNVFWRYQNLTCTMKNSELIMSCASVIDLQVSFFLKRKLNCYQSDQCFLFSQFFFFSFLHFQFLFDLAHINLFSWGAYCLLKHTFRSDGSVWLQ